MGRSWSKSLLSRERADSLMSSWSDYNDRYLPKPHQLENLLSQRPHPHPRRSARSHEGPSSFLPSLELSFPSPRLLLTRGYLQSGRRFPRFPSEISLETSRSRFETCSSSSSPSPTLSFSPLPLPTPIWPTRTVSSSLELWIPMERGRSEC